MPETAKNLKLLIDRPLFNSLDLNDNKIKEPLLDKEFQSIGHKYVEFIKEPQIFYGDDCYILLMQNYNQSDKICQTNSSCLNYFTKDNASGLNSNFRNKNKKF